MTPRPPYVSVIDPIGPAIEQVKMVLFRPFDLGRWFVIGFCAWLAHLAEKAGGGGGAPGGPGNVPGGVRESLDQARQSVINNLYWVIPVGAFVLVLVVGLMFLLAWLRSRGQFMFLYCVAQNKAEVKNPWYMFRRHGNSLFAFRIVFGIIAFVVMAVFVGVGAAAFFASQAHSAGFTIASIAVMAGSGLLFVAAAIIATIVAKLTKDFVVPIMYLHTVSAVQGWRILLDVLSFNKARFFLYLLFHVIIGLAIAAIVTAAGCLTCCCAWCVLSIPYVGTVLFLPVLVFLQAYSLYYLAQYGPEFNAFAPAPQVVLPAGPPMAQTSGGSLG